MRQRLVAFSGASFGPERRHATMVNPELYGGIEPRFMQGVVAKAPRVEGRVHRGGWVLLHWYTHHDGEAVRAITRIEADGDRVARLQNYFFTPDLVAEVCSELGLPWRANGYRWCFPSR
jgi:RNA polymerase sigma-70 factor (ECF subfamily)